MRKNCPVCGVANTGGQSHTWHKTSHRKKGYTIDEISKIIDEANETRKFLNVICHAVDLARQPDDWRPHPKKSRKEYHREYYWRHVTLRRKQRRTSKAMRRKLQPLIADLCHAVDLGRITASW